MLKHNHLNRSTLLHLYTIFSLDIALSETKNVNNGGNKSYLRIIAHEFNLLPVGDINIRKSKSQTYANNIPATRYEKTPKNILIEK